MKQLASKSQTPKKQPGDAIEIPQYLPTLTCAVSRFFAHIELIKDRFPIILDVGCGNSSDLSKYLRRETNVDIEIHGIDVDEYAQENPDVDQVYIGSAEDMPFKDNVYDMVFSQFLLEHVNNAHQTLRSMSRVIRPNGTLVITIPNPLSPESIATKYTPHSIHILFKKWIQKMPNASRKTFPTKFDFKSVKNIKNILDGFGFSSVEIHYVAESYYRFRRRPILGRLSLLYTQFLSFLHLNKLQSSVVIVATK